MEIEKVAIFFLGKKIKHMSSDMEFLTIRYVRQAKPQIQPVHMRSLTKAFASHMNVL